jgi:hypothetical protein
MVSLRFTISCGTHFNPKPTPHPVIELAGINGYMDELKPCPFCGDEVEMKYEPVVCYEITCCVSLSLQICDALEDRGVRFEDSHEFIRDNNHANGYGEYPDISRNVCKEDLAKMWNTRV